MPVNPNPPTPSDEPLGDSDSPEYKAWVANNFPSHEQQDPESDITFKNIAPEDSEWTAHIDLLNKHTSPDRYLRQIIQYARSGAFYPADMHVDLIEQYSTAQLHTVLVKLKEQGVYAFGAKHIPESAIDELLGESGEASNE